MMKFKYMQAWMALFGLIWMASLWGCADRSYLIVDYQVPAASRQLIGQTVRLRVEDQRGTANIMSENAAYQFRSFKDRYSLAWIMPDNERILAGEHDIAQLFLTAFEKRLASMGVAVTADANSQVPELTIVLKEFSIDLQNHKWIANVGYEASLTNALHPTAKENIRGNAERIKVIGRKGADMVVSEIFTEVVNRVDLLKLFQRAKLVSQRI